MPHHKPDISLILKDNEIAAAQMLDKGNYVSAYLLIHALVESLLRLLLREYASKKNFTHLIDLYKLYLKKENYSRPTFVKELVEFHKRRNRIVHELWQKGFSLTNKQAETAARGAFIMFGLFIEWLETFEPEITTIGFRYEG
ncbi:MAG: hypothetical protein MUQ25_00790 [Candidatus Aminicenantes bacterium]|nr:hypothetical protein [Candidatus Aminicenantes bacterium]